MVEREEGKGRKREGRRGGGQMPYHFESYFVVTYAHKEKNITAKCSLASRQDPTLNVRR